MELRIFSASGQGHKLWPLILKLSDQFFSLVLISPRQYGLAAQKDGKSLLDTYKYSLHLKIFLKKSNINEANVHTY